MWRHGGTVAGNVTFDPKKTDSAPGMVKWETVAFLYRDLLPTEGTVPGLALVWTRIVLLNRWLVNSLYTWKSSAIL